MDSRQVFLNRFRRTLSPEDRGSAAGLDLGDADLHRLEETIPDRTEAIRVDRGSPRLHLERAECHVRLNHCEEAAANHDREIRLEADHAAVDQGRCHAKPELWRHEEAIKDYAGTTRLDPASASVSGDR